jgi:hypothetical protein
VVADSAHFDALSSSTLIAANMGLVAEKLLGEPNRALSSGRELRYGNHGSLTAHPRKRRLISSSCEAPGEELDRGEVDHGGSRGEGCLEVFGQPVAAAEPSERPLDQPALG